MASHRTNWSWKKCFWSLKLFILYDPPVKFIYIFFHISGLGCVVTTINPAYTAMEVCRQLIISKTKMILTLPKLVPLAQDAITRSNSEFKTSHSKSGDWESMLFIICNLSLLLRSSQIFPLTWDVGSFLGEGGWESGVGIKVPRCLRIKLCSLVKYQVGNPCYLRPGVLFRYDTLPKFQTQYGAI